ncbi:hypothetical protein QAD02_008549 [Eretmocerus hayati]|uniref:Uncharacterized protein n=1 Tax=Eretmocerus hayati TaxID=131215 RepID=A0ACC2N6X0_9HYME|nr:hypothetical protein QAD02_008549 [Eretmocerus hayati]
MQKFLDQKGSLIYVENRQEIHLYTNVKYKIIDENQDQIHHAMPAILESAKYVEKIGYYGELIPDGITLCSGTLKSVPKAYKRVKDIAPSGCPEDAGVFKAIKM